MGATLLSRGLGQHNAPSLIQILHIISSTSRPKFCHIGQVQIVGIVGYQGACEISLLREGRAACRQQMDIRLCTVSAGCR